MQVVKKTITKRLAFLYLLLPVLAACSDSMDVCGCLIEQYFERLRWFEQESLP